MSTTRLSLPRVPSLEGEGQVRVILSNRRQAAVRAALLIATITEAVALG